MDSALYDKYLRSIVKYLRCKKKDTEYGGNVQSIETFNARQAMGRLAEEFIDTIWDEAEAIVEGESIATRNI